METDRRTWLDRHWNWSRCCTCTLLFQHHRIDHCTDIVSWQCSSRQSAWLKGKSSCQFILHNLHKHNLRALDIHRGRKRCTPESGKYRDRKRHTPESGIHRDRDTHVNQAKTEIERDTHHNRAKTKKETHTRIRHTQRQKEKRTWIRQKQRQKETYTRIRHT